MADITVSELAKTVRSEPQQLLKKLQQAGVSVDDVEQTITEEEKRKLLLHLKAGRSTDETKKRSQISLKRKKVGVVKRGQQKVTVQFRKTRTYEQEHQKDKKPEQAVETEAPAVASIIGTPVKLATDKTSTAKTKQQETKPAASKTADAAVASKAASTATKKGSVQTDTTSQADTKTKTRPAQADKKAADKRPSSRSRKHQREEREDEEAFEKTLHISKKTTKRKRKAAKGKQEEASTAQLEQSFAMPTAPVVYEVAIPETISVADLAKKMSVKAAEVIKVMMGMGAMVTINQIIDQETATLVVDEMGHTPKPVQENAIEEGLQVESLTADLEPRAPVVTIMGHVDHGKTSLLDTIRRTRITSGEAGGITQHIGAYHVTTDKGVICFLDTPGHEAFTAMRARGASCTDIVILVVAADDGVMPQTIEAIQHAKAAGVPIIVAVNKMDKPEADPERVKSELAQHEVVSEEWGGETLFQNISAKTGDGITDLLDSILIQTEVLELKAVAKGPAKGLVLESRLDKGRGPVASVLVTQGQLKKGDMVLAGREFGRVRAMIGDDGKKTEIAGPSTPVEILGLSGTPHASDELLVVADERRAREIAQFRQGKYREIRLAKQRSTHLEGLFDQLKQGKQASLNIVLKTDVQGSLEAISESLNKLATEEVKVNILGSGVGGITESDVNLAVASDAVLIGFNVRADAQARNIVARDGVDLRYYSVIYSLIDEVKSALSGLLSPEEKETITGLAEVREVFRVTKSSVIAGCMVLEGTLRLPLPIRVLRDNVVIFEGQFESLKRFKEDASEVRHGMECGIGIKGYNDIKVGDQIESYEIVKTERQLS